MEKEKRKINESIIDIRVKLQNSNLKKSGKNEYAGFKYFELADFLPKLNELMQQEEINDIFTIETSESGISEAKLILVKGEEKQEYKMPFIKFETPINLKQDKTTGEVREVKSMQDIQYLGALNTYYKRYLYINAFGITDGDVIDGMDSTNISNKAKTASKKQVEILERYYKGENLTKLLNQRKIKSLSEMPMNDASNLIKTLLEKSNKNNETENQEIGEE